MDFDSFHGHSVVLLQLSHLPDFKDGILAMGYFVCVGPLAIVLPKTGEHEYPCVMC